MAGIDISDIGTFAVLSFLAIRPLVVSDLLIRVCFVWRFHNLKIEP